ncbi:MAG: hypothetical protein GX320_04975 [Tissierellia bacterium]|nr:hypothetical protein [Tissierellia bacterium]
MKIRLVSKQDIKNAYEKKQIDSKIDLNKSLDMEKLEKVPNELFQILGETLSFIENINNMEGNKNEDK